jgi:lipopolysaccharide export system permease protein
MKLWDRLLIAAYLKAYFFCLLSLVSLYVVIDLFTNVEDFFNANHAGLGESLEHILKYYGYRMAPIFDRLSEAVVLLAATFTVSWIQKNNELLPLLSAGVSTRRVVRPVLLSAGLMLGLATLNQELVIPRIADQLALDRDDPKGEKDLAVAGAYEPNGIHIEGGVAARKDLSIRPFNCSIPETLAPGLIHLCAKEARYIPPGQGERSGGWLLLDTTPPSLENENWNNPDVLEWLDPGKYFLHTRHVGFQTLTRNRRNWYLLLSTPQLMSELARPDSSRLAAMAVQFHIRLTRPLLGLLLVFLGLAMILRDQNRNVFMSAGLCLVMAAIFFAACFLAKWLGDNSYLSPALSAWLPVIGFGPMAFVLFDSIHT